MKKLCSIVLILLVCFALFSCSNLYQDYSTAASTTVLIPAESICRARNALSTSDLYISVCLEMDGTKRIIEQNKKISDEYATKGMTFTFEKLPVGKNGTISVVVGTDQTFSDNFSVKKISTLDGESRFTVKKKNNLIKVEISTSTVYYGEFETFSESNPFITFTESSTINAPLPVGTTKWAISHNGNLYGRFGEIIDVKNQLMNYKNYFNYQGEGKPIYVNLEGTGESPENIKTPIVYSSFDSTSNPNSPYLYNFANSLNEVGENTESLFNLSSELSDYCFDNAGNLYFIMDECAYKLAHDFDTNSYESAIIDGEFCYPFYSGISAQSIAYDKAQNALYLLTGAPTGGDTNLVKFSNPAGTIYKTREVSQTGSTNFSLQTEDAETDSQSWTAHNGKIYVVSVRQIEDENSNSYNLVLQEYEYEEDPSNNSGEWKSEEDYPINVNNTYPNFTTDIMYQDGSLYVIFRCYNTSWNNSNNYSTGGILKYDISSQTFDSDFGIKGFAPNNSKKIIATEERNISFYAPTNETESTSFYGPTKFVAIMPKKLVFLDQGASIDDYAYNPNNQNNNNIPTKSRIVEYDLSTNSFSSTEITGIDLYISFAFTM
ncbi:MAG: hypothetical protein J6A14_00835 [Spirochaetaceae bacterium]|nr:hypothetical protein [Spirochaetaceae bacterium]